MLSCSRPPLSRSLRTPTLLAALGLAALGLFVSPRASAQVAVLTQNNDNARTGANTAEAALTPAAVSGGHFGKLFTLTGLDASVNGQALYVPGVSIGGATHNVLYAYTSDNRDHSNCGLNAFDADTGAPLWHTLLPLSATYTTAAPVIDPATGTMYVLTKTDNDDTGQTFLRAFDITTGAEKTGSPTQVMAGAPGTGDGSVNGRVAFDGPASSGRFHANDRAALLLLNGVVYTSYAHNSDSFPYHGWVLGYHYDGAKFTQTAAFCTTPNGSDGGIWQSGKGLTADAAGFIYCSVGNGTFDASTKGITPGTDYGMCYLKLRASDLTVVDWFAPFDEQGLSNSDLDLGNSGVVGIPGTTRLFGGGTKFGAGFLLDSTSLGHFTAGGPDKTVLRLNGLTGNDSVGQNPVAWDTGAAKYVYLWANGSNLEQLRYDPAVGTFSPAGIYKQSAGLTSGGSLAVSSSGGSGGILWGVGADGVVRAFDATDVSKSPLWTSALNSTRDGLGSPGHFQFPTVVNGKVYVPTSGRTIAVYGLMAPPVVTASSYQIDCGGGAASPFAADGFVKGGSTYVVSAPIDTSGVTGPAPQAVYQSERWGTFTYALTGLTPGASYALRLHFAEIYWTSAGRRLFNVAANGQPLLTNFDVFAAAGGVNKAVVREFTAVADAGGTLTLAFAPAPGSPDQNAKVSGIELLH